MLLDKKTRLKVWLNLRLSLTILRGTGPWILDSGFLTVELLFQIPLYGSTLRRVSPSYRITFCRSREFGLCFIPGKKLFYSSLLFFQQSYSLRSSLYFFPKISEIKARRDQNQEQDKQKKSRIEHLEKTVKHQQQELKKRTSQVSELERVSKPLETSCLLLLLLLFCFLVK